MSSKDIVIVSACRTPFGRYCGSLKEMDYFDLGAVSLREVYERVGLPPEKVDEVFWGVGDTSVCKDVYTPVAARQTLIKAGLPDETPSISLDKACVSAMSALKLATMAIKLGEIDVAIGGGATSFSQIPLIVRGTRYKGFRIGDQTMEDPVYMLRYRDFSPVSIDADDLADEYGVTREEMDEWSCRSHQNYGKAWDEGKFKDEIIPMEIPQRKADPIKLDKDEQYRPGTTVEGLAKLKPIFGAKYITAGNAPGINDGSAAIMIMTREKAKEYGLEVLGSIVAMSSVATKPNRMAEIPAIATIKALEIAGLTIDDMDVCEINEAFAAVPLVSTEYLCDKDKAKARKLREKYNINGSAVAIGHANTASGARIIMNLLYELRRRGGGYAAGAICGGLAQGDACIIKV